MSNGNRMITAASDHENRLGIASWYYSASLTFSDFTGFYTVFLIHKGLRRHFTTTGNSGVVFLWKYIPLPVGRDISQGRFTAFTTPESIFCFLFLFFHFPGLQSYIRGIYHNYEKVIQLLNGTQIRLSSRIRFHGNRRILRYGVTTAHKAYYR